MGRVTGIEWTGSTVNGAHGCTMVSPGCKKCYMMRIFRKRGIDPTIVRVVMTRDQLETAIRGSKELIFFNSMSDTFHDAIPDGTLEMWFAAFARHPEKQFQILTKRPERMLEFFVSRPVPHNVWLGVSVETEQYLPRVSILRGVDTAIRFVSFEPLLAPITYPDLTGISWIIVGGESDYEAPRPMSLDWARHLRDWAAKCGVPFFLKQLGGKTKCFCHGSWGCRLLDNCAYDGMPQWQPAKTPFQVTLA